MIDEGKQNQVLNTKGLPGTSGSIDMALVGKKKRVKVLQARVRPWEKKVRLAE